MVSVIMSTFNEPESYIKASIESILNQTYKDIEFVIVIDNPSNKKLIQAVETYKKKDTRIVVIENNKNIGLTASLNKALINIHGEYIARMDADDIADVERLDKQIKYLNDNQLDLVGCELRRISEEGDVIDSRSNISFDYETVGRLLEYDNCVAHPSWFAKREIYSALNGYRDFKACEDYDFLLRALKKGFKIGIVNSILLSYRVNTKGISRSNALRQMLSSHYLQKNYEHIDLITQSKIDKYLKSKLTDKNNKKYEHAYNRLCKYVADVKDGKYSSLLKMPLLMLYSKYIYLNLYKMVCLCRIKRGGL